VAEDASCTEAWLNLKIENISLPTEIVLKQNDTTIITTNINSKDTTLFIENLLPSQTYTFQTSIQNPASGIKKSNKVPVTTMDTTSHHFTWETFTFGGESSSHFNDVTIINENNIWAVGEIHTESTDKFDSNGIWMQPYNAVHWDGSEWELKRIMFYTFCNQEHKASYPAKTVFSFTDGVITITSGSQITYIENVEQKNVECIPVSVNSIWGISSEDFYVVGNGGKIAHYNGSSWIKIESGTNNRISDLWGIHNSKTKENEVYFVKTGGEGTSKITGIDKVQEVDWPYTNAIETIWGISEKVIYVGGEGIFKRINNEWIKEDLGNEVLVMDLKGESYNSIVSVGLNGLLNYYNGSTWKTHNILRGNLTAVSVKDNTIAAIGISDNVIIIGRRN